MRPRSLRLILCTTLATGLLAVPPVAEAAPAGVTGGGSLVVLEPSATWPELDPATNPADAGDQDIMNAVYGELFAQGPHGRLLPDLATGYRFGRNDLSVAITLRSGVRFQDGTPFDAQAVRASIERDLTSKACLCASDFSDVASVVAKGSRQVVLELKKPFAPIMEAFVDEAPNWTVSPTALAKDGATVFGQHPVGAGPFEVVSNAASSKLVLRRNPRYWQRGEPKLSSLTFESVGSTTSAYEALQSGAAQVIDPDTDAAQLIQASRDKAFKVYDSAPRSAEWVQINPTVAPFTNLEAREAIYYATDSAELLKVIGHGYGTVTESPTGSGDLFYEPKVPGYRTYDLAKARALVKRLGGLSFTLVDVTSPGGDPLMEALQTEYEAAGMKVKLGLDSLDTIIGLYNTNSWQISLEAGGEVNPDLGVGGLATRFDGFLGNVHDPVLSGMIARSTATTNRSTQDSLYRQIFKRISDQAYGPYLYVTPFGLIAARSVRGITVATGPIGAIVDWAAVSNS